MNPILETWQNLTGQPLNERAFERMCFDFEKAGFTPSDLTSVVQHMRRLNLTYSQAYRLRFNARRVIGDLEWFGSMLGEATAVKRNAIRRTNRDRVLEMSGRPQTRPVEAARPIKDLLLKAIEGL